MSSDPLAARPAQRRGLCLVLVGPSGSGKTSLSRKLLEGEDELGLSISATTRAPRNGEIHGTHYFFVSDADFDRMIAGAEMLEWAGIYGKRYGTPIAQVEPRLAAHHDVLFDIDWQGYCQIKEKLPHDTVGVFIRPPSREELIRRLTARGDDAEEIVRRVAKAAAEIAHAPEFDYIVDNMNFDDALGDLRAILRASRRAARRVL